MKTKTDQSEIDMSNLRKNLADRTRTLKLQEDEISNLKENFAKKLTEKDHQIAVLKTQVSEIEIELHNKNCNSNYKQKYEDLLEQVRIFKSP